MASSKLQQDRFEKTLKQLLRQQENKSCMHCCSIGPTYVVPKYAIFICTQCSGVQRDFARCKSISMSKFDQEEVDLMKERGNAWAMKTYLASWSDKYLARPTDRSKDKLERWIKKVFEEKQFYTDTANSENQTGSIVRELRPIQSIDDSSSAKLVELRTQQTITSGDSITQCFPSRQASSVASLPPPLQVNFDPFGDAAPSTGGGEAGSSSNSATTINPLPQFKKSEELIQSAENVFDPFGDIPSPVSQPAPQVEQKNQNSRAQLPEDIFCLDQILEQPQQTNNGNIFGQINVSGVSQQQFSVPAAPVSNFPVQQVYPQNQHNSFNVPVQQQYYGQNQQNTMQQLYPQGSAMLVPSQPQFVPQYKPENVTAQVNYQMQRNLVQQTFPMYQTNVAQGQFNLQQQQPQQQKYMQNMQPQYNNNVSLQQQAPFPSQQTQFTKQFSMGQVGVQQSGSGGLGGFPQFQSFQGSNQNTNFANQGQQQQQQQIQPYQLQSQMQSMDIFSDLAAGVFGKKDVKNVGKSDNIGGGSEFIGVPKATGNPFA